MLRWGRLDSTQLHGKWKWNTFSKQDPLSYQLYCLISATWRRCVAYRHEWTKGRGAVVLLLSYLELLLADRYVGTSSFRFTLVFIDFTVHFELSIRLNLSCNSVSITCVSYTHLFVVSIICLNVYPSLLSVLPFSDLTFFLPYLSRLATSHQVSRYLCAKKDRNEYK